jgi:16S rRNA (guanine527-N7)-methyltransferase
MGMFRQLLASEFAPYGELSEGELSQLQEHYELLVLWNKKINLTRIASLEDVVRFHYCESLFLAKALPVGAFSLVDVGSGAGFPGVPLAIVRPECRVHLLESHQRKAVFLGQSSRELSNIQVAPMRAEDCRKTFDWMIARAVRLGDLMRLSLAPRSALLLGESDARRLPSGFRLVATPWGNHRMLALTADVPRETVPRETPVDHRTGT